MGPSEFYKHSRNGILLDARSPAEHAEGHIPGAKSFPLFTNEERAEVGTVYKREGKRPAVLRGLDLFGPRIPDIVQSSTEFKGEVFLYCWRGGMRSGSMAWLLETAGHRVNLLEGGYKAYRNFMYEEFEKPRQFITVSGFTGSGKTDILHSLSQQNEQIIDLEGLANHYGSAFGNLENEPQPTTEHFQNILFEQMATLDLTVPTWVEDESQHIGQVWINDAFFKQFKSAPMVIIHRSLDERVDRLCQMYGKMPTDQLAFGFEKIGKRLGGQHVKRAIESLQSGDLAAAASIALNYYDKTYRYMITKRNLEVTVDIDASGKSDEEVALDLIKIREQIYAEASQT